MSFDIRKFLTENKLTKVSKSISENVDVFSDEEVVDLAFKAGEFVIDAKTALLDVAMGYEYGVPRKVVERILNNFDMSVEELLGGEDSDQYDSLTDMPGFEGTRDALNNLGLKEYQHLDDLKQPNSAKGMEGRHSMEETLDDQPVDRDPTDGRGVNTSFDPSKYESVEQLMREIEVTANRAALQEKMKRVKEAYESLDQKATALEEGEDSKYMSSAKLKEMKKNAKTLRGMYEKYEKDYNKRFNEEMKPRKKLNESLTKEFGEVLAQFDVDYDYSQQEFDNSVVKPLLRVIRDRDGSYNFLNNPQFMNKFFNVYRDLGYLYNQTVGDGGSTSAFEEYESQEYQQISNLFKNPTMNERRNPIVAEQIRLKRK